MKIGNLIDGLLVLREHYNGRDGYHIGAEHDQFYAWVTDTPLSEEEVTKMRSLGWFQPDSDDEEYNPEDSWSAFT